MIAPLVRLLSALEATTGMSPRKTGTGYRAACPACSTRTLKVSVAEAANGAVLLHAFCGHTPGAVLAACGLALADLYDARDLRALTPDERRTVRDGLRMAQWRGALPVLTEETSVVLIAANQLGDELALSLPDLQRVRLAALRLFDAREVLAP